MNVMSTSIDLVGALACDRGPMSHALSVRVCAEVSLSGRGEGRVACTDLCREAQSTESQTVCQEQRGSGREQQEARE